MASNGSNGNLQQASRLVLGQMRGDPEEKFELKKVFQAFTELPRVTRLVWSTSWSLTLALALISLLSGILPAASVWISGGVLQGVFDAIVSHGHNLGVLWFYVAAQLVVGLLQSLTSTLTNIFQQLLQERVGNNVQFMILQKAETLDLSFFEDAEFYDKLRNAANESTYKPMQMVSQVFTFIRTLITLFSMLAILLQLAWWLALIAMVLPIPSFISSSRYGWRGYHKMRRQSPKRRMLGYLNQLMTVDSFNKEIKLFNLGRFLIRQYKDLSEEFYQENKKIVIGRYLAGFSWGSLSTLANSGIYIYVALQAVYGSIKIAGLTRYTQAVMQVGSSFQGVLDGFSGIYENNLFVNTLYEFLEYKPHIISPTNPHPLERASETVGMDIEFRNVSFTYPGKDPATAAALRDVSFTIKAGEAIALVGSNGAGKTTIVKLLTRLYDPDQGQILVGGRDIREYDIEELRRVIGVIFQDYVNYHMNARENIGVGRIDEIENIDMVTEAAIKSGASAIIDKLPSGYATMLGRWFKEGAQLSGGEWQKVALARAFMRNAPILVLDEPTSSLDAQAEYDIFTKFRLLTAGKTAIFISHRFSTVRLADRIFVIEQGVVKENGSHSELMTLNGRYAELFNLQAEAYR
ncbi:MAG TPA: ABC transporter ATP-binding protein [Ktedonobacteraceae bacterium]